MCIWIKLYTILEKLWIIRESLMNSHIDHVENCRAINRTVRSQDPERERCEEAVR